MSPFAYSNFPMPFALNPWISFHRITFSIVELSYTVCIIILVFALIDLVLKADSDVQNAFTSAVSFIVFPFALIDLVISQNDVSYAISIIILPFAYIDSAVSSNVLSYAVSFIVLVFTFIDVAFNPAYDAQDGFSYLCWLLSLNCTM